MNIPRCDKRNDVPYFKLLICMYNLEKDDICSQTSYKFVVLLFIPKHFLTSTIFTCYFSSRPVLGHHLCRRINWYTRGCRLNTKVSFHRTLWLKRFYILLGSLDLLSHTVWKCCHRWCSIKFKLQVSHKFSLFYYPLFIIVRTESSQSCIHFGRCA